MKRNIKIFECTACDGTGKQSQGFKKVKCAFCEGRGTYKAILEVEDVPHLPIRPISTNPIDMEIGMARYLSDLEKYTEHLSEIINTLETENEDMMRYLIDTHNDGVDSTTLKLRSERYTKYFNNQIQKL